MAHSARTVIKKGKAVLGVSSKSPAAGRNGHTKEKCRALQKKPAAAPSPSRLCSKKPAAIADKALKKKVSKSSAMGSCLKKPAAAPLPSSTRSKQPASIAKNVVPSVADLLNNVKDDSVFTFAQAQLAALLDRERNRHSFGSDDFMEVFSPPRVAPIAQEIGMHFIDFNMLSLDVLTGFDFLQPHSLTRLFGEIILRKPKIIGISPPSWWFSPSQDTTYLSMNSLPLQRRCEIAVQLWNVACCLASHQITAGRWFWLEHPCDSSAWLRHETNMLLAMDLSVKTVTFDQCMLCKVSKEEGVPVQQRTTIMTNVPTIVADFESFQCNGCHSHQVSYGVEGGLAGRHFVVIHIQLQ
jgi:hypothetical protein